MSIDKRRPVKYEEEKEAVQIKKSNEERRNIVHKFYNKLQIYILDLFLALLFQNFVWFFFSISKYTLIVGVANMMVLLLFFYY